MAAWLNSLETMLRAQHLLLWIGILAAFTAALSSGTAYWLSRRVAALREEQTAQELAAAHSAQEEAETASSELEELRQQLSASQDLSTELQGQIDSLQQQVQRAREETRQSEQRANQAELRLTQNTAASAPAPKEARPGALGDREKEKLTRALSGKPAGSITLITVQGSAESQNLAADLNSILLQAGWQTEVLEAVFRTPPQGLAFIVQSRENMPESVVPLSLGLTIVDLMPMPARVQLNPNRPPGFLGLIVGSN